MVDQSHARFCCATVDLTAKARDLDITQSCHWTSLPRFCYRNPTGTDTLRPPYSRLEAPPMELAPTRRLWVAGVPRWATRTNVHLLWQKNAMAKVGMIWQRQSHVAIYRRHRALIGLGIATATSSIFSSPVEVRGEFWSEEIFLITSSKSKIKILLLIHSCTFF